MKTTFMVCVRNTGYEASLERRKLYAVIPDREAEKHAQRRVVDESGEDYLYPADWFAPIRLPAETREVLVA
ncbi:hypothetical protein HQ590_14670 [bacterium]|nr:hypothetical protein [bacterium]